MAITNTVSSNLLSAFIDAFLLFVKAKYLQNYVSSIKELSGENTIYRLTNKYSLLKTRFSNWTPPGKSWTPWKKLDPIWSLENDRFL